MRIAQIAPLAEAVPPKLYGGTERVVSWLTESLVDLGHDVTLFASGDSTTCARHISCAPAGLRLCGVNDHTASTLVMLDKVFRSADDFDVLHFHVDLFQYPLFRGLTGKCLTTLHGRQDLPDNLPIFTAFPEMKLVSISDNQRLPIAHANFIGTVHHGMPVDAIKAGPGGDYLAFIGRISPEKRPDRAIEIAKRAGLNLKIAAKVDRVDEDYFRNIIEPLIDGEQIEFINEVGDVQKQAFLGQAKALLFPIDWPEPFGLVMIEAMAAGTPIIAWCNGSTSEVIEQGRNGFLVESIEEAVAAVQAISQVARSEVRAVFEERFTAKRMAQDYLKLYSRLAQQPPKSSHSFMLTDA
jgi:glycosyltransferase involved in cell wall biosynthesis